MIEELKGAREIALRSLPLLYRPEYGFAAGMGRFDAFYTRDLERFIELAFRHPANVTLELLDRVEHSLDTAFMLQGRRPTSPKDDQALGKIIHQWQNGWTPRERIDELLKNPDWRDCLYQSKTGEREIRYYGAGDVTSGVITAAFRIAQAKQWLYGSIARDDYLGRVMPYLEAAYYHEINIADIDGDGLIESVPKNKGLLLHHTERDSDYAYDLENGVRPHPPFKYLSNNSIFLDGMDKFVKIAHLAGDSNLEKEAREIVEGGKVRYLELFWTEDLGYMVPLVYGDRKERADFISDEAIDALYYGLVGPDKARRIVSRFMQPDLQTPFGPRTRSIDSTQFAENEGPGYWNGAVWPHRVAIGAEALDRYGFHLEALELDRALGRLVRQAGCVEVSAVSRDGQQLLPYTEDGVPKACNPHLFAIGGDLARTARNQVAA